MESIMAARHVADLRLVYEKYLIELHFKVIICQQFKF
jgi:hypothetical protein